MAGLEGSSSLLTELRLQPQLSLQSQAITFVNQILTPICRWYYHHLSTEVLPETHAMNRFLSKWSVTNIIKRYEEKLHREMNVLGIFATSSSSWTWTCTSPDSQWFVMSNGCQVAGVKTLLMFCFVTVIPSWNFTKQKLPSLKSFLAHIFFSPYSDQCDSCTRLPIIPSVLAPIARPW